jgi:hypothetical protein
LTRWSPPRFRHADLHRRRCAGARQDWSEPSRTSWPCEPDQDRLWHSPPREGTDRDVDRSLRRRRCSPCHGNGSTLILKEAPKNYSGSNGDAVTSSPPLTSKKVLCDTSSRIQPHTSDEGGEEYGIKRVTTYGKSRAPLDKYPYSQRCKRHRLWRRAGMPSPWRVKALRRRGPGGTRLGRGGVDTAKLFGQRKGAFGLGAVGQEPGGLPAQLLPGTFRPCWSPLAASPGRSSGPWLACQSRALVRRWSACGRARPLVGGRWREAGLTARALVGSGQGC